MLSPSFHEGRESPIPMVPTFLILIVVIVGVTRTPRRGCARTTLGGGNLQSQEFEFEFDALIERACTDFTGTVVGTHGDRLGDGNLEF
ncbi:hypothetical protein C8Q74DRAFT_1367088 [Fomes fomentarius]|nr:hypothetical protein C8Q74DRAFT_1367088 [Fomes fomentarius]